MRNDDSDLSGSFKGFENAQKNIAIFLMFVHTYLSAYVIIILVTPPNTLYIVFATPPIKRNTFS